MASDDKEATQQPIAVCHSYDDVRRGIVAFCEAEGKTRQDLDAEAGLADGHSAKLLAPRTVRKAVRRFGDVSFGRVLDALGLELVLRRRPDAGEAPARDPALTNASDNASDAQPHPKDWRRKRGRGWARRMAARRALLLTPQQRTESARKAAQARWQRRLTDAPDSRPDAQSK